jgi:hypothetical protein
LGFYEGELGAGIRGFGDFLAEEGGWGCFFWEGYPVNCQSTAGEGICGALGDAASAGDGEAAASGDGFAGVVD